MNEVPSLDRAFARLLAEEMRPYVKEEIRTAVRERIGEDHAEDHKALREFLDASKKERETRKERWERIRVHVIGWSIVTAIGAVLFLGHYWLTTVRTPVVKERTK